jgi:hypothetical protein
LVVVEFRQGVGRLPSHTFLGVVEEPSKLCNGGCLMMAGNMAMNF